MSYTDKFYENKTVKNIIQTFRIEKNFYRAQTALIFAVGILFTIVHVIKPTGILEIIFAVFAIIWVFSYITVQLIFLVNNNTEKQEELSRLDRFALFIACGFTALILVVTFLIWFVENLLEDPGIIIRGIILHVITTICVFTLTFRRFKDGKNTKIYLIKVLKYAIYTSPVILLMMIASFMEVEYFLIVIAGMMWFWTYVIIIHKVRESVEPFENIKEDQEDKEIKEEDDEL